MGATGLNLPFAVVLCPRHFQDAVSSTPPPRPLSSRRRWTVTCSSSTAARCCPPRAPPPGILSPSRSSPASPLVLELPAGHPFLQVFGKCYATSVRSPRFLTRREPSFEVVSPSPPCVTAFARFLVSRFQTPAMRPGAACLVPSSRSALTRERRLGATWERPSVSSPGVLFSCGIASGGGSVCFRFCFLRFRALLSLLYVTSVL